MALTNIWIMIHDIKLGAGAAIWDNVLEKMRVKTRNSIAMQLQNQITFQVLAFSWHQLLEDKDEIWS